MSVTLELKPEVEARAIEQAVAHGVPVEACLESVIEGNLSHEAAKSFYDIATAEEWETASDDFANSPALRKASTIIDDSRESIYGERENSQL